MNTERIFVVVWSIVVIGLACCLALILMVVVQHVRGVPGY